MHKAFELRRFAPGDDEALIARGLRGSDDAECFKTGGLTAAEALRYSVRGSDLAAGMWIHGKIAAVCGVASPGALADVGAPWLLAHDDFERADTATAAARASLRLVECWAKEYGRLQNVADPQHTKALRFLDFLGFHFDWGQPVTGPFGHQLVRFWR